MAYAYIRVKRVPGSCELSIVLWIFSEHAMLLALSSGRSPPWRCSSRLLFLLEPTRASAGATVSCLARVCQACFLCRRNRPELLPSAERPATLSAALSSPAVAQFFELSALLFLLPTAANQKELCITAQLHFPFGDASGRALRGSGIRITYARCLENTRLMCCKTPRRAKLRRAAGSCC